MALLQVAFVGTHGDLAEQAVAAYICRHMPKTVFNTNAVHTKLQGLQGVRDKLFDVLFAEIETQSNLLSSPQENSLPFLLATLGQPSFENLIMRAIFSLPDELGLASNRGDVTTQLTGADTQVFCPSGFEHLAHQRRGRTIIVGSFYEACHRAAISHDDATAIATARSAQLFGLRTIGGIFTPTQRKYAVVCANENTVFHLSHDMRLRTALSMLVKNSPRSFFNAISCFHFRNVEVTFVTNLPLLEQNSSSLCLMITEGGVMDGPVRAAIDQLPHFVDNVKVLGTFVESDLSVNSILWSNFHVTESSVLVPITPISLQNSVDFISLLPRELALHIVLFSVGIHVPRIKSLCLVSQQWRRLILDDLFWQRLASQMGWASWRQSWTLEYRPVIHDFLNNWRGRLRLIWTTTKSLYQSSLSPIFTSQTDEIVGMNVINNRLIYVTTSELCHVIQLPSLIVEREFSCRVNQTEKILTMIFDQYLLEVHLSGFTLWNWVDGLLLITKKIRQYNITDDRMFTDGMNYDSFTKTVRVVQCGHHLIFFSQLQRQLLIYDITIDSLLLKEIPANIRRIVAHDCHVVMWVPVALLYFNINTVNNDDPLITESLMPVFTQYKEFDVIAVVDEWLYMIGDRNLVRLHLHVNSLPHVFAYNWEMPEPGTARPDVIVLLKKIHDKVVIVFERASQLHLRVIDEASGRILTKPNVDGIANVTRTSVVFCDGYFFGSCVRGNTNNLMVWEPKLTEYLTT